MEFSSSDSLMISAFRNQVYTKIKIFLFLNGYYNQCFQKKFDDNLCILILNFINALRHPLTKLNLVVFSTSCPNSMSFQIFHDYGISQINSFASTTTSFLITKNETIGNCNNGKFIDHIIVDPTTFNAQQHLHMISYNLNPRENFLNLFVLVLQSSYNETINFIVKYMYNSGICGPNTASKAQHKAYYIKMRVKFSEGNKLIKTVIPWIDYKKHNLDFETYVRHNLDYLFAVGEERCWRSRLIKDEMIDIYQSSQLQEPFQQHIIFFSDYFPDWFNNTLLSSNETKRRNFDYVYYKSTFQYYEDEANQHKFYKTYQNSDIAIGFYMINSTNIEAFPLVGTCKAQVDPMPYDIVEIPSTMQWWIWLIVGYVTVILIALIAIKIRQFYNMKKKNLLNLLIANKLNKEEKKLFLLINEELYINENTVEVDYETELGKGVSSHVYKAILTVPSLHQNKDVEIADSYTVAAKIRNKFEKEEIEELIKEIEAARKLQGHPNVCAIIGWSINVKAPCLLFELMEMDLLSYLKSLRVSQKGKELASSHLWEDETIPEFDEKQQKIFLQILWQASRGLEFIALNNIVHRDVAARNFLLARQGHNYITKIADFGLSSDIDKQTNVYHASFKKKLPVKWLALECFNDQMFSQASDVWAFGITMIEVYTCGKDLYPDVELSNLFDHLITGKRIEMPDKMPKNLYDIAYSCWNENPYLRPLFSEIQLQLQHMLRENNSDYYFLYIQNNV